MYTTTPIAVSKSDRQVLFLAWLPLGFMLVIIFLSLQDSWSVRYFQLENLYAYMIALFFLLMGAVVLWGFYTKIFCFEDGIEMTDPLGRRTHISWREVERIDFTPINGKKKEIPRCRIYAQGRSVELRSDTFENYKELESLIRRFAQKWSIQINKGNAVSMDKKGWIVLAGFVGVFAGLLILLHVKKPVDDLDDLSIVQIVLNAPPLAQATGKQRKTYAYVFSENQYPEFNFQIDDQLYYALKENKQLQAGDTLELHITTAALRKKLLRTEEATFWEKHIDWPKINVHHFKQVNP